MLPPHLAALALLLSPALAVGLGEPVPNVPPKVDPTRLDNFTWADPFQSPEIDRFGASCEGARTFAASEFQLHDLSAPEPAGLQPYAEALRGAFGGRPYPGGWDGMDAHGYERSLLRMEYGDVPARVRQWIEEQEYTEGPGRGLFAVLDKPGEVGDGEGEGEGEAVGRAADLSDDPRSLDGERAVVFAPGALYETLPLWVAEGSGCEGTYESLRAARFFIFLFQIYVSGTNRGARADALANLESYGPSLVDGGVVGWPTEHTKPSRREGSRSIKFTIKARVLSGQVGAEAQKEAQEPVTGDAKDEL